MMKAFNNEEWLCVPDVYCAVNDLNRFRFGVFCLRQSLFEFSFPCVFNFLLISSNPLLSQPENNNENTTQQSGLGTENNIMSGTSLPPAPAIFGTSAMTSVSSPEKNNSTSGSTNNNNSNNNSQINARRRAKAAAAAAASGKKLLGGLPPPSLESSANLPQQPPLPDRNTTTDPALLRFYAPFQSYVLHPNNGGRVLDASRRTHPKGFRYRVMSSPLERNMNSYFKIPSHPPKKMVAEFDKVHTAVQSMERQRTQKLRQAGMLDGFALLKAGDTDDANAVVEVSVAGRNLVGVVEEDLAFFTCLRVLDAGDNAGIGLVAFQNLPSLEELHLQCNNLTQIGGAQQFMLLHTLNVAFNRLTKADFILIGAACPVLQRLDFSHNQLGSLSRDDVAKVLLSTSSAAHNSQQGQQDKRRRSSNPSGGAAAMEESVTLLAGAAKQHLGQIFQQLVQLALENNGICDETTTTTTASSSTSSGNGASNTISALGDLPRLQELNCNHNKIESIILQPLPTAAAGATASPSSSYSSGPFVPFPSLTTFGLANNNISSLEAIAALSRLPSLRRVMLFNNPLSKQRRLEADLVAVEFESIGVEATMLEPGKMARAKIGKFYNRNDCPFFAVESTDGSGLPRRRRKIPVSSGIAHQPQQRQQQQQHQQPSRGSEVEMTIGETVNSAHNSGTMEQDAEKQQQHHQPTGPSFFMTATADDDFAVRRATPVGGVAGATTGMGGRASGTPLSTHSAIGHREHFPARDLAGGVGRLPAPYGQPLESQFDERPPQMNTKGSGSGGHRGAVPARLEPMMGRGSSLDPDVENPLGGGIVGTLQDPAVQRCSAGATLRSVVSDLRRALRQPLPPLPM